MPARPRVSSRLALAALLLAGGCERGGSASSSDAVTGVADTWLTRAIESTGDRAALVLALDPERFGAVVPYLRALVPWMPDELASRVDAAVDPSQWVRLALNSMQVDVPALTLPGWDRGRPLVLALAEPPRDGPTGTIAAGLPFQLLALPGLRHQIVVPATDPAALAAELVRAFTALGLSRPTWATEQAGPHVWGVGEAGWVSLRAEPDAVRLVVVSGGLAPPGFFADPSRAKHLGDPAQQLAAPRTAGLGSLGGEAIGLLLRPRVFPALWTWLSGRDAAQTLALVAPDQRTMAQWKGLEILVGCEVFSGGEAPEVDDYALGLSADGDALRLRLVASLTPRGAAALDAGAAAGGDLLTVTRPGPLASGWLRFDADAATKTLGEPVSLLPRDDLAELAIGCNLNPLLLASAAPLGDARRLYRSLLADAPKDLSLPTRRTSNAQFVVTEASPTASRIALTGLGDAALDEQTVRDELAGAGAGLGVETHLHTRPEGDLRRYLLGLGVDPREVFGAPRAAPGLLGLRVDLAALTPLLQHFGLPLPDALRPFRGVDLEVQRSGRALVAELVLATAGDPKPRTLDLSAFDWSSPAPTGAAACGQRFGAALLAALRQPQPAPPPADEALQKLAALDAAAGCLADHPELAAVEPRLRRLAPLLYADGFAARWQHADATRMLEGTCSRGDGEACARRDALRDEPVPTLPEAAANPCPSNYFYPTSRIAVTPAGLALDGVRVADADALRRALVERLADPNQSGDLGLGVDRAMTMATVRPVLAALRGIPRLQLFATLRGPDSAFIHVPIILGNELDAPTPPTFPASRRMAFLMIDVGTQALHPDDGVPGSIEGLHVSATDGVAWSDVAAGLARSCTLSRLIDPAEAPRDLSATPPKAAGTGRGTLDKDIIRRIVRAHMNEVRYCYTQGLARDPNARGRVSIAFTIAADGRVPDASVAQNTLKDATVSACIATAVKRWAFPRPEGGGSVQVTYPFVLEPG